MKEKKPFNGEGLPTSSQVKVSAFNNIKIAPGVQLNLGKVSVSGMSIPEGTATVAFQSENQSSTAQFEISAFNNIKVKPGAHLNLGGVSVNNVMIAPAQEKTGRSQPTFFKKLPANAANRQLLNKIDQVIKSLYDHEAFQSFQQQAADYLQPFRDRLLNSVEKQQLDAYLADAERLLEAKRTVETLYPNAEDSLQILRDKFFQPFSKLNFSAEEREALTELIDSYKKQGNRIEF
jgi:hypothetical protein